MNTLNPKLYITAEHAEERREILKRLKQIFISFFPLRSLRPLRFLGLICIIFLLYGFVVLVLSGCATVRERPAASFAPRYVRVAVVNGAKEITLSIHGHYRLLARYTGEVIKEGESLKKIKVKPTHSGFMFGDEPVKIFAVTIEPFQTNSISVNSLTLRGSIELVRKEDVTLLVINHIDVEDYLKGVLPAETSRRWSGNYSESLKALAVTARTYALYQEIVSLDKDFGMTSDVYSQVYGGRLSERRLTNYAVNATSGVVLTYKGRLFPAYHHSTCGGHTEDASELWEIKLLPLEGVPCDFCRLSPWYRWQISIPLNSLGSDIIGMAINERNASGRARSVSLKKSEKNIKMSAKELRQFIGFDILRSTKFDVSVKGGFAQFTGQGWGHGAGLCQWGAYGMAKDGYDYTQILKYYYPGAELKETKDVAM